MNNALLPVHPRLRHPLTGEPLVAVGFRNPRLGETSPRPIWPMMGGDPTNDDAAATAAATAAAEAKAKTESDAAAAKTAADAAAAAKAGGENRGYPDHTSVADMKLEEQTAYWKYHAQKHETSFKKLAGDDMTPEKLAAMQKQLDEYAASKLTDNEKAIADAKKAGREEALSEAGTNMVKTLKDAHVVAAGLDKEKDANVIAALDSLNHSSFINEDNTVDAARLTAVLNHLAPLGAGTTNAWPATGQGDRKTGAGSAKDAGKAEAAKRFGTENK